MSSPEEHHELGPSTLKYVEICPSLYYIEPMEDNADEVHKELRVEIKHG